MTGFHVPQLLTNLYRDLRDRRLLALAIVLLAGIAAVPIALGSSSKRPEPKAAGAALPAARKSSTPAVQVVAANPGLRDYRLRLKRDPTKDPFKQQYTAPAGLAAAQLGQTSALGGGDTGAVSPVSSSGTTAPSTTGTSVPTGSPISQPVSKTSTKTKYVAYRIDVRTGPADGTLETLDKVGTFVPLPSQSVPALAFIGVTMDSSLNAKTASFLLSSSVSSIGGEGVCILGSPCQMLSLKPGQYEDLVWTDGLTYRLELVKFEQITRSKLSSAGGQRRKRPHTD